MFETSIDLYILFKVNVSFVSLMYWVYPAFIWERVEMDNLFQYCSDPLPRNSNGFLRIRLIILLQHFLFTSGKFRFRNSFVLDGSRNSGNFKALLAIIGP